MQSTPQTAFVRRLKVLIVEDDELGAKTLAALLDADGHLPHVVHNGRQAIERLRGGGFDLLITDIYMPDMDGIELLRTLRQTTEPPPIIAISGGGRTVQVDYLDLALRLGARQVLRKPFTLRVLRATIQAALEPPDEDASHDGPAPDAPPDEPEPEEG